MRDSKSGRRASRAILAALCIVHLALFAGGCARARAAAVSEGPPLQMPEPPQRVLVPVEEPASAAAPDPVPQPAAAAPPRAPARPPEPRPQPAPAPAAQLPPDAAPVDTRELRAAPSSAATEGNIREVLARAARDIGRINYVRLSADGRAQYEQSKRFSEQAEQALRDRNLIFAATLADKAATLAAELVGR